MRVGKCAHVCASACVCVCPSPALLGGGARPGAVSLELELGPLTCCR